MKQKLSIIIVALFFALFFYFLFHLQIHSVSSFGCFDDCSVFVSAYFMLKGKILYSQIFFNHQMLFPYISFLIQKFSKPHSIYTLLVYHRLVGFGFSVLMDILLIWRFKKPMIGFIILYELTKHYLFGDRFLPEAFIVYPSVYLLNIAWNLILKNQLKKYDYILSGLFIWFIAFSREPYVPLAITLFVIAFVISKKSIDKLFLSFSFIVPSFFTLLSVPLNDYFFNVVYLNSQTVAKSEIASQGNFLQRVFSTFFYPIWAIFQHKPTIMGNILFVLSLLFVFLSIYGLIFFSLKNKIAVILSIIILDFANLRFVRPGTMYYEAFHMIIWYGLFVAAIFLMLENIWRTQKKLALVVLTLILGVIIYSILSPSSFIWERVDRTAEFVTNYGQYVSNGSVINALSSPKDNVFLDGYDDLIYWQANRTSFYKYSWYTSLMPSISLYVNERDRMLHLSPPDFYFGLCQNNTSTLPKYLTNKYREFYFSNKPTCLYIKQTKMANISMIQWEKIKQFGYYLKSK